MWAIDDDRQRSFKIVLLFFKQKDFFKLRSFTGDENYLILGGTNESQWEDVTGSTPLTFMNDRVSFTTTVSARFWLMDCRNIGAVPKMATELYEESLHVPYITK